MSAQEIIEQIKELPPDERAQVAKFVVEHDDLVVPDEFKEAMKDAEAGRFVDMESALTAMANDPHIQRELRSIHAEFAVAESDGLGQI